MKLHISSPGPPLQRPHTRFIPIKKSVILCSGPRGAPRAANWFDLIINMFSSSRPTPQFPHSPEVFYVSKSASLSVWRVFPRSAGRLLCSEVLKAPPAMVTGCLARSCVRVVLPCDILSRCVPLSMPDVTTAPLRDLSHTLSLPVSGAGSKPRPCPGGGSTSAWNQRQRSRARLWACRCLEVKQKMQKKSGRVQVEVVMTFQLQQLSTGAAHVQAHGRRP